MITAAALAFPGLRSTVTGMLGRRDAARVDALDLQIFNQGHDLQLPYLISRCVDSTRRTILRATTTTLQKPCHRGHRSAASRRRPSANRSPSAGSRPLFSGEADSSSGQRRLTRLNRPRHAPGQSKETREAPVEEVEFRHSRFLARSSPSLQESWETSQQPGKTT